MTRQTSCIRLPKYCSRCKAFVEEALGDFIPPTCPICDAIITRKVWRNGV